MRWTRRPRCAVACCLLLLSGCVSQNEQIELASAGPRPSVNRIDADPWSLLPRGAIAWWRVDEAVFESAFSEHLKAYFAEHLPVSRSADFEPEQSIQLMVGSVYASAGNDVVAICRGSYDEVALEAAHRADPRTELGRSISAVRFAGATMYVTEQMALSVLSARTIVMGTQLGVRRTLEVVEEARMQRALPAWFESLLSDTAAHFQLGADLDAQPVPAVFHTDLEFMNHLRAARVVGNFAAPGLNFAGSLTFSDPHSAQAAVATVSDTRKKLEQYDVLLKTMQIPQPVVKLEAAQTGKDAQIVAELSGEGVAKMLTRGQELFGDVDMATWLSN